MAKAMNDAGADAALDYWTDADLMIACSAQPTSYAEATSTYALADVAMAGGDFTKTNGDTSGRKVTVAAKSAVDVDVTGDATHVALVKTGDTTLRYVTTCPTVALDAAGTVNFGAWDIEIPDPS